MKVILSIIILSLSSVLCKAQEAGSEMIRFIVQPEAELNKSMDFELYFDSIPDEGSLQIDDIAGLDIIRQNGFGGTWIQKKGDFYSFYTYATPTRPGKIEVPPVSIKVNGVEYKSKPFSFNVVEKIEIGPHLVRTVLVTDKSSYNLKDTIKLSLYQYSRFSHVIKGVSQEDKAPDNKDLSISGEGNEIKINITRDLHDISGIKNLEEYLDKNFEIIDFDWQLLDENQSMEMLDNNNYIKTELFSILLLANNKGTYTFQPSIFEYQLYKSNSDYFGRFTPNEDGSYNITNNGSILLKVSSNPVQIKVK